MPAIKPGKGDAAWRTDYGRSRRSQDSLHPEGVNKQTPTKGDTRRRVSQNTFSHLRRYGDLKRKWEDVGASNDNGRDHEDFVMSGARDGLSLAEQYEEPEQRQGFHDWVIRTIFTKITNVGTYARERLLALVPEGARHLHAQPSESADIVAIHTTPFKRRYVRMPGAWPRTPSESPKKPSRSERAAQIAVQRVASIEAALAHDEKLTKEDELLATRARFHLAKKREMREEGPSIPPEIMAAAKRNERIWRGNDYYAQHESIARKIIRLQILTGGGGTGGGPSTTDHAMTSAGDGDNGSKNYVKMTDNLWKKPADPRKGVQYKVSALTGDILEQKYVFDNEYRMPRDPRLQAADDLSISTPIRHPRHPQPEIDDSVFLDHPEFPYDPIIDTPVKFPSIAGDSPAAQAATDEELLQAIEEFALSSKKIEERELRRKEQEDRERAEEERILAEKKAKEDEEKVREAQRKVEEQKKAAAAAKARKLIQKPSAKWMKDIKELVSKGVTKASATQPGVKFPLEDHDFATLLLEYGHGVGWLNDQIVNSYIGYAVNRALEKAGYTEQDRKAGKPPPFHNFNSAWHITMKNGGVQAFSRWAKRAKLDKKKLLEAEALFFPICSGHHWTLLVVFPKARKIEVFDSLHGPVDTKIEYARDWLRHELGAAYIEEEWIAGPSIPKKNRSPGQTNALDCGVFTCFNAFALIRRLEPTQAFSAEDMSFARYTVAAVLLHGGHTGEFDWAE